MKTIIIAIALLLGSHSQVLSQMLSPAAVNSGGRSSLNGNILLEDNIGGLMINTIGNASFMYTQGFLQPDAGTTSGPVYINDVTLSTGGNVIDNAGATLYNGALMLEFSTGEVASKTLNSAADMLTQGVLQPYTVNTPLPITGLEFYAKRINNTTVQLDWKTIQEFNNKGFHIERKKENESAFSAIGFVASTAAGGSSSIPLQYQKSDNNNYSGKTLYRIKQEDIDGRSTYSVLRIINGDAKQAIMQVWPVPSAGPVNVLVNGLTQADNLAVYDMSGKLVQQHTLNNNQQLQLSGLRSGVYVVRLANNVDLVQRIVVQ